MDELAILLEHDDLRRLAKSWARLSRRTREGILVHAGIRPLPRPALARSTWRRQRGDTPEWLISALNMLKDSSGYMTDREIARRLGVANSTLVRSAAYQHARKVYLQEVRKLVRRGAGKRKSQPD